MRRLALLVLVLPALAGCGSSSSETAATETTESARTETAKPTEAVGQAEATTTTTTATSESYGGLGSTPASFHRENAEPPPNPAGASPGLSWYTILATLHGRVTAIREEENDEPNGPNEFRLSDVSALPIDKEIVQKTDTCWVWRSHTLKKLIGDEYAVATTETGAKTAELHASDHPVCE